MTLKDKFIEKGYTRVNLEDHIKENFPTAGYSHLEMERVPLGTRIVIHCDRPGIMIGRGGEKVQELTKIIEKKFGIENPQLDIKNVENSYLDPQIVSEKIASSIERGVNYKRTANITVNRIMNAGAIGCFIRIGGKMSGEMSRFEKFSAGYLKHAGEPARALVERGKSEAQTKMGTVGVQVKIVPNTPEVLESLGYSRKALEQKSMIQTEEEEKEEAAKETEVENILEEKEEQRENILDDKETSEDKESSEEEDKSKDDKETQEETNEEESEAKEEKDSKEESEEDSEDETEKVDSEEDQEESEEDEEVEIVDTEVDDSEEKESSNEERENILEE